MTIRCDVQLRLAMGRAVRYKRWTWLTRVFVRARWILVFSGRASIWHRVGTARLRIKPDRVLSHQRLITNCRVRYIPTSRLQPLSPSMIVSVTARRVRL